MLKWKWLLIVGLIVAAGLFWWRRGIRLGLDLQGGIHLVVRVDTDDALKAELDDAVNRVRQRLEEKKIPYQSVERVEQAGGGFYGVTLTLQSADDLDRATKVAEVALRDFAREVEGSRIVAKLPLNRVAAIREQTVEQALTTISERVNATGVEEPIIQRQGLKGERILVQLPGLANPERIKQLIGRVAYLELKMVSAGPFRSREEAFQRFAGQGPEGQLPATLEMLEGSDEEGGTAYYVVERAAAVTGRDLSRAQPDRDELGQPAVAFQLNTEGARKFGDVTGKNVGRQLAIVLDGRIKSAPVIRSRISDRGQIAGGFSQQEARDLSLVLRSGALPAKIQYLEERTIGPFLGADSIRKGIVSGLVGLAMIIVFMVFYYRLSGVNAVIALLLNGVYLLGAIAMIRATLTLPGIAGVILTLGMAVDANVLIFESIRESLRAGVTPRRSVEEGFTTAFGTIIDTHLTTIGAAGALWMLGSGPVRGFGVTLVIGLVISMFTAYYVSKTIFESFVLRREWKPGDTLSI